MNILDVWFDSGVSHAAVLERRADLRSPADMYLEGSDQHRGWFHSSLLESIGTRDRAPYRSVLTHGFVVDGAGKKMSKSVGNVIDPQEIIDKHGAEILRLWVAAEDYRVDIRISKEILDRLIEAYRRIRNTSRYILGNLYDFNPACDLLPYGEMEEMDRWALHRLQELIERVKKAYDDFEFHMVYYAIYNFCTVELSAMYLDVSKDRLYTSRAESKERRSAQSAMYMILDAMVRLLAPILTFTAEEIWAHLPQRPGKEESVHLAPFPELRKDLMDEALMEKWKKLVALKAEISKAIETARKDKLVGHSLDTRVTLGAPEGLRAFLEENGETLKTLNIVSELSVGAEAADAYRSAEFEGLTIGVDRAPGKKCQRCWMYSEWVGTDPAHEDLCERCRQNIG